MIVMMFIFQKNLITKILYNERIKSISDKRIKTNLKLVASMFFLIVNNFMSFVEIVPGNLENIPYES